MNEGDEEQQYNRSMARLRRLVLMAFVCALCGGLLLFAAVTQGVLWLVYAGVLFLAPFGLILATALVWLGISNAWHLSQDYERWRAGKINRALPTRKETDG